ncbi:MAG: LacI family DNA-binding transcriptional regulator [Yoonia sp.]|nr:LacI family DNA-binding transcriptional regulator [Yoonia sp.]
MPADGKPTLKTIAKMSGLAVTTVSRALNGAPDIGKKTKELAQKIAAETGYVPNTATGPRATRIMILTMAPLASLRLTCWQAVAANLWWLSPHPCAKAMDCIWSMGCGRCQPTNAACVRNRDKR